MASTPIDDAADAIKSLLDGLSISPSLTTYKWLPRDLDSLPAAVIELPDVERTVVEGAETQLGSNDWRMRFPVNFHFDLSEPVFSQDSARKYLESFIQAVDADTTLGNVVDDAKVIQSAVAYDDNATRALLIYETTVETFSLIA